MEQNRLKYLVEDILAYLHSRVDARDHDHVAPDSSSAIQSLNGPHRLRHATPPNTPR